MALLTDVTVLHGPYVRPEPAVRLRDGALHPLVQLVKLHGEGREAVHLQIRRDKTAVTSRAVATEAWVRLRRVGTWAELAGLGEVLHSSWLPGITSTLSAAGAGASPAPWDRGTERGAL